MFENLLYWDFGLFLLRLAVAAVFLYHGAPKLKKYKAMSAGTGMPAPMVLGLGAAESLAALGLIFGAQVQASAFLLSAVMVGAIYYKKFKWGIPFSAPDKTGWEFDLILLAANLAILFTGGGA
ncbi:MAG: hypothetical protein A3I89_01470 [Candidatus Harrisonbacteria bacterium RIFCSPLOWO2_02_FULL_41_11]|uniref:DoxX family protein n=1 Tax=Candidatus Harrisonbacteria bacterium RIFCSPHIGHO2_02_FULL_42_16 TaxID=1798404 RepID=A0A1G1ZGG4_9BACT|nr:MAG: hypothetical protein A3B92_04020 [Candidatus Harrisonbacteria bacterium RIFCSPHIGHO2_02_FULL_42_16]OGY66725.1 MAG: hypothetical protein A3I89_01470 [Candidatus Harrisonbacteria bacterium RIFCSPLOWO2_02_FULL_41_11]